MTLQFDLGTKHIENKKQAVQALSEISSVSSKEKAKELLNKSYGVLPQNSTVYDDYLGLVVSIEEIAKNSAETASILTEQVLVQELLSKYATEIGKNSFDTNKIYAILCSEPGINQFSKIKTKATKTASGWTIEGVKSISKEQLNADNYLVFTKDEENLIRVFNVKNENINLSLITKNIAGTEVVLNKIELNMEVQDNFAIINDNFERNMTIARTLIAAVATGIAHSALVASISAVKGTKDSDNIAISNSQSAQFTLADMFMELDSGRVLTYLSADLIDNNKPSIKYATMAKVQATDSASSLAIQSLQLLGNIGYLANNDFAEIINYTVSEQVKGGTNRVQKNHIYQYMLAKK